MNEKKLRDLLAKFIIQHNSVPNSIKFKAFIKSKWIEKDEKMPQITNAIIKDLLEDIEAHKHYGKVKQLLLKMKLKDTYLRLVKRNRRAIRKGELLAELLLDSFPRGTYKSIDELKEDHPEYETIIKIESVYLKRREEVAIKYAELAQELHTYPTSSEFYGYGVGRDVVRNLFGTLDSLIEYCQEHHPEYLEDIYVYEDIVSHERREQIKELPKKVKRFVITSIGTGSLNHNFYDSLLNYAKYNKAEILLMPTKVDLLKVDKDIVAEHISGRVHIVTDELKLCNKLFLNDVEIDEKVMNPTAGLQGYRKNNASFIYASPKQTRHPVPVKKVGFPRMVMSTGAITNPSYRKGVRGKTKRALMAENDHMMGALVVEIDSKDSDIYYVRQLQADDKGCIADWGYLYSPKGKPKKMSPKAMVFGDLHSRTKDLAAYKLFLNNCKELKVEEGILHDAWDGKFSNPHERGKITAQIALQLEGHSSMSEEAKEFVRDVNLALKSLKRVRIIDSNHNDMLQRSFDSKQIFEHSENTFTAMLLQPYAVVSNLIYEYPREKVVEMIVKKTGISKKVLKKNFPLLFENKPTLQVLAELYGLKESDRIVWHGLNDSYKVGGFELADHGHKGSNGARGNLSSSKRTFAKRITGHSHTDGQLNYLVAVGHLHSMTPPPGYTLGSQTSWLQSCAHVYDSGHFQLITNIHGKLRNYEGAYGAKKK